MATSRSVLWLGVAWEMPYCVTLSPWSWNRFCRCSIVNLVNPPDTRSRYPFPGSSSVASLGPLALEDPGAGSIRAGSLSMTGPGQGGRRTWYPHGTLIGQRAAAAARRPGSLRLGLESDQYGHLEKVDVCIYLVGYIIVCDTGTLCYRIAART